MGLSKQEWIIINKLLEKNDNLLNGSVDYEVRLALPKEQKEPQISKYTPHALWQREADLVVKTKREIRIVEIKPKCYNANAVGELLLYRFLYELNYKPDKPIVLWIITEDIAPDIKLLCRRLGIFVRVV
jgi:hypothetical protein